MCRMMLGSNPVLLRLWHWQLGTLTTRQHLIHESNLAVSFEVVITRRNLSCAEAEVLPVRHFSTGFAYCSKTEQVAPTVQLLNSWFWPEIISLSLWRIVANEWEKVFFWPIAVSRLCWYTQRRMRLSSCQGEREPDCGRRTCAGIFKQSMGARTEFEYGCCTRPARLHRLAKLTVWNRFLGFLKVNYTWIKELQKPPLYNGQFWRPFHLCEGVDTNESRGNRLKQCMA